MLGGVSVSLEYSLKEYIMTADGSYRGYITGQFNLADVF